MSAKHPVIAVTGSSGAGTTTTSLAFRKIFAQLNLRAAEVEGDSFHRYTRPEMDMAIRKARSGQTYQLFWPGSERLRLLEQTFIEYGQTAKASRANICTPMMRPFRGIRFRGPSPLAAAAGTDGCPVL
jgi:phosphoribulokinase